MTKLSKLLSSLILVSVVSGCTNTIVGIVKPICISKHDVLTAGTEQQILTQDETLGKSCK